MVEILAFLQSNKIDGTSLERVKLLGNYEVFNSRR